MSIGLLKENVWVSERDLLVCIHALHGEWVFFDITPYRFIYCGCLILHA